MACALNVDIDVVVGFACKCDEHDIHLRLLLSYAYGLGIDQRSFFQSYVVVCRLFFANHFFHQ